ncbi:MAG: hypothetical protein JSU04_00055 [Bdellovibrionales bacterium]|nr:hypothetical protein [Bdellovibrionales bacterium]
MAQYSGFFNSVAGDRLYGADELARFYNYAAPTGIMVLDANDYDYGAASGLSFTIGTGAAMINGYFHNNVGAETFFLSPASGGQNRIDVIVLRLNKTAGERKVSLAIKQGTAAASPVAPTLSTSGDVFELALYQFYVPSGASSMAGVTVTDLRQYSMAAQSVGFANGNVPSSNLNNINMPGLHFLEVPGNFTNNPSAETAILEVFRTPNGRVLQRVTEIFAGSAARNAVFQRSSVSGVWSEWVTTYSGKRLVYDFTFVGGATASGDARYAVQGDKVRIEAVIALPSGMSAGTTIATLATPARPSGLTYIAPIISNTNDRVQFAITSTGALQVLTSVSANMSVTVYDEFLLNPIR